jgi:hypothetical protein
VPESELGTGEVCGVPESELGTGEVCGVPESEFGTEVRFAVCRKVSWEPKRVLWCAGK